MKTLFICLIVGVVSFLGGNPKVVHAVKNFGVDRTKEFARRSGEVEIRFVTNNTASFKNPW